MSSILIIIKRVFNKSEHSKERKESLTKIIFKKNICSFIIMDAEKNKPVFDKRIFWDVDFDKLDYGSNATFIIERVFERGDVNDIRECRRYYGDEKLRLVLTKAKWLTLHNIYLACALFENEPTDYRCYITAQSNPNHFLY